MSWGRARDTGISTSKHSSRMYLPLLLQIMTTVYIRTKKMIEDDTGGGQEREGEEKEKEAEQ